MRGPTTAVRLLVTAGLLVPLVSVATAGVAGAVPKDRQRGAVAWDPVAAAVGWVTPPAAAPADRPAPQAAPPSQAQAPVDGAVTAGLGAGIALLAGAALSLRAAERARPRQSYGRWR